MVLLERSLALLMLVDLLALSTQTERFAPDDHATLAKRSSTGCQDCCDDVCLSVDCVPEAATLIVNMNLSADPCEDFAEFACGRFHQLVEKEVLRTMGSINPSILLAMESNIVFDEILLEEIKPSDRHYLKAAKILYRSCKDLDAMDRIGFQPYRNSSYAAEWPTLVGPGWRESANFSLADLVVRYAVAGTTPLFNIQTTLNRFNKSFYHISVDSKLKLMMRHDIYLRPRNNSLLMGYETFVQRVFILIGAHPILAVQDAAAVVDLEVALSKIKVNKKEESKTFHERTLSSLYHNYSWLGLPQAIRAMYGLANVTLDDDQIIVLVDYDLNYFSQVKSLLQNYTERELRNLFGFHYLLDKYSLTDSFFFMSFPLTQLLYGIGVETSRAERCLFWLRNDIKHNIAREYIRRTFSEQSKNIVVEMVENVRAAFNESLHEVTWMDDSAKQHLIEKLWALKVFVGYPDSGYSEDELDKRFEAWQFTLGDFCKNLEILNRDRAIRMFRKIVSNPSERWDLMIGPLEANAFYETETNQAWSQFDKFGNLHNWWDAYILGNYTEREKCFIDQYDNYTLPQLVGETNYIWNGQYVVKEIMADNDGLRQSYKAYRKLMANRGQEEKNLPGLNLTFDQLFFLTYSQGHCSKETTYNLKRRLERSTHPPDEYRISGVLQNFPEFAQAYNCPVGSRMNPEKKCLLF